jgi:ketosteroid isomerase-like protein
MSVDPVAFLTRYHAALNAYDAAVVGPMFSADAVYVSPGVNGRLDGRDAIIAAFSAYFAEHPDQRAEDDRIEQTGPREVRARWRLRATAASSGRQIVRQGTETVSFDGEGLIVKVSVEDQ